MEDEGDLFKEFDGGGVGEFLREEGEIIFFDEKFIKFVGDNFADREREIGVKDETSSGI